MAEKEHQYYEGQERCMGTVFRLHAFYPAGRREWMHGLADRLFDELLEDDRAFSIYRPESEVNRINRAAGGEPVAVEADVFELLEFCRRWWQATGGLFDITVGAAMRAYGFHVEAAWPADSSLEGLRNDRRALSGLTGCDKLELDERNKTARLARPGMLLDLGGIAKGWAVRKRAGLLVEAGLEHFALSAGTSTVLARGAPEGSHGWPMELEAPPGADSETTEMVLTDCAVSVSGNYRNTLQGNGGATLRHIIDPLTLEPVAEIRQVVAVGQDAAECEVLSTAYLIQGGLTGRFALENRPDISVEFYLLKQ
ncbi:MAG: FAD:protein FMN transferase [Candidatus Glassbacteria bacterium]|nr:FAD:protein FMN transferase [Candidatus Glassbacteria bacterium]